MRKKITALLLAAIMLLALTACGTTAQPASTEAPAADAAADAPAEAPAEETTLDYPTQNISWIVPVAAGAGVDLVTRQVADMLDLGVNFSIENITGGQQAIGTKEALSRPANCAIMEASSARVIASFGRNLPFVLVSTITPAFSSVAT